jgi:hypothetical protein
MNRFLHITVGIVCVVATIECQTVPLVTIGGHVIDDSTRSPLFSVNVFIAGTMMSTSTDTNGTYILRNIPLGSHDLIISLVGYETIIYPLHLTKKKDRTIDFRLKQRIINLPTTEITEQYDKTWKENLEIFTKEFIGSSFNAKECHIINPEILDFKYDSKSGNLTTSSERPLYLENLALGYRIMILLNDFSKTSGLLRYTVQLRFEELQPPDSAAVFLWKTNRHKAYRGSLRHFLHSVITDRVAENGFVVQESDGPIWSEVFRYNLDRSDIICVTTDSLSMYERYINFPGYLRIMYLYEREPDEYVTFRHYDGSDLPDGLEHQTSWIQMKATHATVDMQGNLLLPYSVKVFGYWAFQRIADTLPREYKPEESE